VIRVVVDMNLGGSWVGGLSAAGIDAVHWSSVGHPTAPDAEIFAWAALNDRVILTCDLDFTDILASSGANKPSVLVLRVRDVTALSMGRAVANVLLRQEDALKQGALIMLDAARSRLRVLPLKR
jgi:predicted nuclease of predicted toxin-antitoxin system